MLEYSEGWGKTDADGGGGIKRQPQKQRGISCPFAENLIGVSNNKLRPTPPPSGGYEGRSSHYALNTHFAQIKTHTHTQSPDADVARGKAAASGPPTVSPP